MSPQPSRTKGSKFSSIDPKPYRGWHGTIIPARIADLVQYFANRDAPMTPGLAQKRLRILDTLVDMGDRRSAALQLSEAFREIRLAAEHPSKRNPAT